MFDPTPLPTQHNGKKIVLLLLLALFGVCVLATRLPGAVQAILHPKNPAGYEVALNAQVTSLTCNRQQYTYQLNGEASLHYSFNMYEATNPADRQGMSADLGYDPSDLGHYLQQGDYLTKAANSPLLLVRRGNHVTRWLLAGYGIDGKRIAPATTN